MRRIGGILLSTALILLILLLVLRPDDEGGPHGPYFSAMQTGLRSTNGEGAVVLDWNAVLHNVEILKQNVQNASHVRLVAKSLPSADLLWRVSTALGTKRIMVFHVPFLQELLQDARFAGHDFLWGLPVSKVALENFGPFLPDGRVQWLADTSERLRDIIAVAAEKQIRLRVSLEIDVGLHRGGFASPQDNDFVQALSLLESNAQHVTLSGLMGYDGHVQGDPFHLFRHDVQQVISKYLGFVSAIPESLKGGELIFNGAGTTTITYYRHQRVLNDLCCGSLFTKPAHFDLSMEAHGLRPALFLAGVVIKHLDSHRIVVPFIPQWAWSLFRWWNPNFEQTFFVEGSSMPGTAFVSPPGVRVNPLEEPNTLNLFPTQAMVHGSKRVGLSMGDMVFSRPGEADSMLGYANVRCIESNGHVTFLKVFRGGV